LHLFDTLGPVLSEVIDPLKVRSDVLVLMDSLHGDGPSLKRLEDEELMAIIGANKLRTVKRRLMDLPTHCAPGSGQPLEKGSDPGVLPGKNTLGHRDFDPSPANQCI